MHLQQNLCDLTMMHICLLFQDLQHFSGRPTSQRTCFSVISGPTASLSQPTSQHTCSFHSFRTYSFSSFNPSTNRLASCRRCIPSTAHNHCLFIHLPTSNIFLPILTVNIRQPTSLSAYQPTHHMCFASAFLIQRTDSHPNQGSLGHAWNAVFLPNFAAYGSSSGGLNFGRDGPVTHKFFPFRDLEHFPGQPTSQRTCFFFVISGPTAPLNQPTSQRTCSFNYCRTYSFSSHTFRSTD